MRLLVDRAMIVYRTETASMQMRHSTRDALYVQLSFVLSRLMRDRDQRVCEIWTECDDEACAVNRHHVCALSAFQKSLVIPPAVRLDDMVKYHDLLLAYMNDPNHKVYVGDHTPPPFLYHGLQFSFEMEWTVSHHVISPRPKCSSSAELYMALNLHRAFSSRRRDIVCLDGTIICRRTWHESNPVDAIDFKIQLGVRPSVEELPPEPVKKEGEEGEEEEEEENNEGDDRGSRVAVLKFASSVEVLVPDRKECAMLNILRDEYFPVDFPADCGYNYKSYTLFIMKPEYVKRLFMIDEDEPYRFAVKIQNFGKHRVRAEVEYEGVDYDRARHIGLGYEFVSYVESLWRQWM